MDLGSLSDRQLHLNTMGVVRRERTLLVELLHHLAEVERRRLFSDYSCSSLFDYCIRYLGYSEGQAHRRITAMRMIRQIPQVEKKISKGHLSLSNVAQAQTFFNQEEKHRETEFSLEEKNKVLHSLENKSTREAQKGLLSLSSNPKTPRERERVVSEKKTELRIIADEELMSKLQKLKGLLAHKKTNPSYAELLGSVCDMAIEQLEPKEPSQRDLKKVAALSTSQVVPQQKAKRKALPQSVKRVVWHRDRGRCVQCGSQHGLEYDHINPVALGGGDHPDNIALRCKPCNQRAAIQTLGLNKMIPYLYGPEGVQK